MHILLYPHLEAPLAGGRGKLPPLPPPPPLLAAWKYDIYCHQNDVLYLLLKKFKLSISYKYHNVYNHM